MSTLSIRNAKKRDIEKIYKIETDCFPEAEAASKEALKERIKVFPSGFLVAELDGEIIGFINGASTMEKHIKDEFFTSMKYHEDKGKTLMIYGLDVSPKFQRKGYAAKLMYAFIDRAIDDNRERIILTCKEHLVHYYSKFGFANEGISESAHGGAAWYDMFKVL